MSYLVLSLKYRPQTFDQVVGQDHITQTLTNAFEKDRVSQAYIFTGPRGVGKTTNARLVAKALNCKESPGKPCNKCSNCVEITDGRNMDVLEIDGASNRGIEEIRGLREAIQYTPINSKYKIFIIDEVHMLTTPAFNALLRTLEEPPKHGKFILATTDIYKVPATIISRCQRFDFNSISIKEITKRIRYILDKEKIAIDDESLRIIGQKADGSMRDALSILDQVIAYSGNEVSIDGVNKVLGLIPNELYFTILEAIQNKDGKTLIDLLAEVHFAGMPIEEFVTGLNRHLRNMMVATVKDGLNILEINKDLKNKYIESAKAWSIKDLLRISKVMGDVEPQLKKAVQPHILLELTLLRLLEFDASVSIQSLLDSMKSSNGAIDKATVISKPATNSNITFKPKVETKPKVAEKSEAKKVRNETIKLDIEDIKANWDKFLNELSNKKPSVSNALGHCELGQIAGNRLEIKMVNGNNFNLRTLEKNKIIIEEFLEKVFGVKIKTAFLKTLSDAPKKENIKKHDDVIKTNETTAKIIEIFDGEIIN